MVEKKINNCLKIVYKDKKYISKTAKIPYYPLAIKRGRGAIVEDLDGNKYIDFLSSASALNVGHSHPKVVKAIKNQIDKFIHYTPAYMYHQPLTDLAEKLVNITPGDFEKKVIFGLSGSDANDGVIKFARAYTNRKKIISFIGAYHGSTYGAISLSAISINMREKIGPLLPEIYHIPYPNCYRCPVGHKRETCKLDCFKQLENALNTYIPISDVAAVIMEPIAGDAGIVVPPKDYVRKIFNLCKKNDVLFVSEEVQQGFMRTGKWFAIEHFDIVPDAIVMAKSIASGMPLSAIVARKEILESLEAPAHLFTTSGNPVSCQAAIATIDILSDKALIDSIDHLSSIAFARLKDMQSKYDIIGDVRGKGLSIGVELVNDKISKEKARVAASKISYRSWEMGLILSFFANNVIRIQPPLVISEKELIQGLNIIEQSIKEYIDGEIPDKVLQTIKGW